MDSNSNYVGPLGYSAATAELDTGQVNAVLRFGMIWSASQFLYALSNLFQPWIRPDDRGWLASIPYRDLRQEWTGSFHQYWLGSTLLLQALSGLVLIVLTVVNLRRRDRYLRPLVAMAWMFLIVCAAQSSEALIKPLFVKRSWDTFGEFDYQNVKSTLRSLLAAVANTARLAGFGLLLILIVRPSKPRRRAHSLQAVVITIGFLAFCQSTNSGLAFYELWSWLYEYVRRGSFHWFIIRSVVEAIGIVATFLIGITALLYLGRRSGSHRLLLKAAWLALNAALMEVLLIFSSAALIAFNWVRAPYFHSWSSLSAATDFAFQFGPFISKCVLSVVVIVLFAQHGATNAPREERNST